MGDRDLEKNMDNPDTVQKVCGGPWLHQTEWTVLVIAPRLCPRDASLDLADHNQTTNLDTGMSCQRARVTKGCEFPKGVSNQRVRVAKGYEHQEVQGPRGTQERRGACSKRCLLRQVVSDPYGSVYDWISQDKPKAGSGKEVRWAIEPDFMGRSNLDSIRNQAKHCTIDPLGCWVSGQGRGLSPEGFGSGVGLCPTQTQSE
ncbi:hypothetical protein F2Q69_00021615 [Brassica cretica]|uniref:Uncharacterized protein n=1 Tax=Brassica cretica TaxID=69181 RepID=A0A8S9QD77_BRACR|nr:hypothetical protein F2Q69_00021615 [Brassica cretica]